MSALGVVIGGGSGGGGVNVSAASNATPIQITTSAAHNISTGATVIVTGALGNTAANGTWIVTKVSSTQFTLTGSTGNGAYTANSATIVAQADISVGATNVATISVSPLTISVVGQ
jgi:hypothetical protein